MIKQTIILYIVMLALSAESMTSQQKEISLTFSQALQILQNENKSIKIAGREAVLARNERQRINSFWFPKITATGAYIHMTNEIEVKESLSQFTDPAVDFIHSILPYEELLTNILNEIGKSSFSVPLLPRNMTSVDAIVTLPLFTGGKRIYAGKIGKQMEEAAQINKEKIYAEQQVLLVETYYGLCLGQEILEVKKETYEALDLHYRNALKLEANGMLTKAERLFFQVNRDEAKRELEIARKDLEVMQKTFKTIVKIDTDQHIKPTSNLFINPTLPHITYYKELVSVKNYQVNQLYIHTNMQRQQLKIARSAYLPNIELFGKQTLYANGIPRNLSPRTMIGVGFVWNIFDGLDREKNIRQAKITQQILDIQKEKITEDINLAVDKFYNQTQTAIDNVEALKTTIEMSRELVRTRRKAYTEGMATAAEVVDAELLLSKVRLTTLFAYYQFDTGLINLLAISGVPETFYQYSQSKQYGQK